MTETFSITVLVTTEEEGERMLKIVMFSPGRGGTGEVTLRA
jgi:hypothetical protein